jgi:hypothetical protein
MMLSSIPIPEHYRCFHGWAASFALHALAGGLIFLMTYRLTLPPAPEPFTWNVVVQASPSSNTTETAQMEPELATPHQAAASSAKNRFVLFMKYEMFLLPLRRLPTAVYGK